MAHNESKNVEGIIRSLLISSKYSLPSRKINQDFQQLEGLPIPYRRFGYSTLDEYLCSLQSLVAYNDQYSYELLYHVHPHESDSHIYKFVRQQKCSKSVGGFVRTDVISKTKSRRSRSSNSRFSQTEAPESVPPSDIQSSIIELLKENKELHFNTFCQKYRRKFGALPDYKSLGFKDLVELLKSMKDCIEVTMSSVRYIPQKRRNTDSSHERNSQAVPSKSTFECVDFKTKDEVTLTNKRRSNQETASAKYDKTKVNNNDITHVERKVQNLDLNAKQFNDSAVNNNNNNAVKEKVVNLSICDKIERSEPLIAFDTVKITKRNMPDKYVKVEDFSDKVEFSHGLKNNAESINHHDNELSSFKHNASSYLPPSSDSVLLKSDNIYKEPTVDSQADLIDFSEDLITCVPFEEQSINVNIEDYFPPCPQTSSTPIKDCITFPPGISGISKSPVDLAKGVQSSNFIPREYIPHHVPRTIVENLYKLVKRENNGIFIHDLVPLYKKEYGTSFDVGIYGYSSLLQLINNLPELFMFTLMPYSGNSVLLKTMDFETIVSKDTANNANTSFSGRIKSVLLQNPGGLSVKEFSFYYIKEYPSFASDLDWKKTGHSSLIDLFKTLGNDIICVIESVNPPLMYHPQHYNTLKPYISNNKNEFTGINLKTEYQEIDIENLVKRNATFEVRVAEVYSPMKMFLILDGTNYYTALEDLMNRIQMFYCNINLASKYRLPSKYCVLNHPVITLFREDNNFYRGLIVGFKDMYQVEVMCVDYGTVITVSKDLLFHLKKEFLALPKQAIEARLWGIKSKKRIGWPKGTSQRLLKLVSDKVLQVEVKGCLEQTLSVKLYDNKGKFKILINQSLVTEQFADAEPCLQSNDELNVSVFTLEQLLEIKVQSEQKNTSNSAFLPCPSKKVVSPPQEQQKQQPRKSETCDYFKEIETSLQQQRKQILCDMIHNPSNAELFNQLKDIQEQLRNIEILSKRRED